MLGKIMPTKPYELEDGNFPPKGVYVMAVASTISLLFLTWALHKPSEISKKTHLEKQRQTALTRFFNERGTPEGFQAIIRGALNQDGICYLDMKNLNADESTYLSEQCDAVNKELVKFVLAPK